MIAYIKGKILKKNTDNIIIENNGLGYRIFLPATSLTEVKVEEIIELYTYMNVREDAILLYGFLTEKEKDIFVKLLSISGLGPKTALAVVSHISPENFMKAISDGESAVFAKVPGIGKKTAQRIILELKGKVDFIEEDEKVQHNDELSDVIAALIGLGYNKVDINNALSKINIKNDSPQEIIKNALKLLAKV